MALGPIALLIALGYGLRRTGFPGDGFWRPAETLTYWVLFPALIFRALVRAPADALAPGGLWAVLITAALAMSVIALVLCRGLLIRGPQLTSVAQGSFRFNTYIGMTLTQFVWGDPGVTQAAFYLVVMVPLGNALAVAFLSLYGSGGAGRGIGRAALDVATNPQVLAAALGIAANLADVPIPAVADGFVKVLADAALPVGLLCVGAGLVFRALPAGAAPVALAVGLKLGLMPALTAAACSALGVGGLAAAVAILFNATPGAPVSYVMASRLGGDAPLMAGILSAQTLAALVSLPIVLAWL